MANRQRNALPSNSCNPEKAPNASRQINTAFTPKLTQNAGGCCLRLEISRDPTIESRFWSVTLAFQAPLSRVLKEWAEACWTVMFR